MIQTTRDGKNRFKCFLSLANTPLFGLFFIFGAPVFFLMAFAFLSFSLSFLIWSIKAISDLTFSLCLKLQMNLLYAPRLEPNLAV